MKDPARLLERGASDMERQLLQAGAMEEPPGSSMKRAAAVLGVSAGAVLAARGAAAVSLPTKIWVALKWVGIGVAGVGTAALLYMTQSPAPVVDPTPPSAREPAVVSAPEPAPAPEQVVPVEPAEVAPADPPARAAKPRVLRPAPVEEPEEEPKPAASTLREQQALIEQARVQLRQSNPNAALETLNLYQSRFPSGSFSQDAALVRMEALAASGNRSGARALAERFLVNYPNSVYAKRVDSFLKGLSK
jgi:hypothetical protein